MYKRQNYDWPTTSAIVRYAYTGKLELSSETVVPQLRAADYYQVDLATEAVLDFMVENMSADDCLVVHDAALPLQDGRGEMAARRALDFARVHFDEVALTEAWRERKVEAVIELLGGEAGDRVKVKSEDAVFEAVQRWLRHDGGRGAHLAEVMGRAVRLPQMSPAFFVEHARPLLDCDLERPECQELYNEAEACMGDSARARRALARLGALPPATQSIRVGWPAHFGPCDWLVQALYSRSKDGATPLLKLELRAAGLGGGQGGVVPTHWTRTGQQDAAEERPAPKPSSALLGRARAAAHSEEACLLHVTDGAIKSMLRSAATDQGGLEVLSIAGAREAEGRFADALRDHTALKDLRFRDAPAMDEEEDVAAERARVEGEDRHLVRAETFEEVAGEGGLPGSTAATNSARPRHGRSRYQCRGSPSP